MNPSEQAAREWARGYLSWLAPRRDELFGRKRTLWYRLEMLQESLGIRQTDEGYEVPYIASAALRDRASHDPAAFDLMLRIIQHNRRSGASVPANWRDVELALDAGEHQRPKKRGRTGAENGVRDLILLVMAQHLTETFGLEFSGNDETRRERAASACEVIADTLRDIGEFAPEPRSIEKAIRRCAADRPNFSAPLTNGS